MASEPSSLPQETKLEELDRPTLDERRGRGDLLAPYRNTSGWTCWIEIEMEGRRHLRRHSEKLRKETYWKDMKNSFPEECGYMEWAKQLLKEAASI